MASPDPIVVERQMYLDLLGIIDDPSLSLSDLKSLTGGGARVDFSAQSAESVDFLKKIETGTASIVYVSPLGNDTFNKGKTWAAAKKTIAGALSTIGAGNDGEIRLDFGVHEVDTGISLSGYRCNIIGRGSGMVGSTPKRTVIKASNQAGPVLDLTGFLWPQNAIGKVEFGNFNIQGSNIADATKTNAGIKLADNVDATSATGLYLHDITITQTGGPPLNCGSTHLSDFERIIMGTPVDVVTNDVPYFIFKGGNGNRFYGMGFRSISASGGNVGLSGALIIDESDYTSERNVFHGTWFEFIQPPSNGTIVSVRANGQVFEDTYFVDCGKVSGATNVCLVKFLPPTILNLGGNTWRGLVPGYEKTAQSFDYGIEVGQSRNLIHGVKGYAGKNVHILAGVSSTYVELFGAFADANLAAVQDDSGNTTNIIRDYYLGLHTLGTYFQDTINGGPRFYNRTTATSGRVSLGTGGQSFYAAANDSYFNGNSYHFRKLDGTSTGEWLLDVSFRPGLTFPDHGALPAAASTMRGKVVLVIGAAGVADQLYICRKNALDTYEWAPLV